MIDEFLRPVPVNLNSRARPLSCLAHWYDKLHCDNPESYAVPSPILELARLPREPLVSTEASDWALVACGLSPTIAVTPPDHDSTRRAAT